MIFFPNAKILVNSKNKKKSLLAITENFGCEARKTKEVYLTYSS